MGRVLTGKVNIGLLVNRNKVDLMLFFAERSAEGMFKLKLLFVRGKVHRKLVDVFVELVSEIGVTLLPEYLYLSFVELRQVSKFLLVMVLKL